MILNSTYFVGEVHIPQTGASASTLVNQNSELQRFIDQYEVELIELALGRKLSDEFYTQIDTNGSLLVTADPKWDRLLNGHSYIKNNMTYYWCGLIDVKGSLPLSMMAYYVYFKYINEGVTQKTSLGVVKADGKNGDALNVSASPTLTRAWRKMYKWFQDEDYRNYGYHVPITYYHNGAYIEDHFRGADNTKNVSLYQFMIDNVDDYDDWHFTPFLETVNQFGL